MRISKKQRLIKIQQVAIERGGECRATVYVNNRTKMPFVCAEGHEWEARPSDIKNRGSWCPHCAGNAPLTLVNLRHLAAERGGECLAAEYVDTDTPLRWRCSDGHEWEATPNNVKNKGTWCPQCAGNVPLTLDNLRRVATERGGECLAAEYVNAHTPVCWRCAEGHEWEATPTNVRNSGRWCPYCAGNRSLTLKDLHQMADEHKGKCLATEYVNTKTKVRWRCKEGHEWDARPGDVKKRGSWCPYCAGKAPLTLEILQQVAAERGGECLAMKYVNSRTPVRWRCAEGHEWEATPNNVRNHYRWCPHCHNKSENAIRTMLKYALGLDFPSYSPKSLKRLGIELRNTTGNLMHLDGFNIDICAAFEFHGHQHTDGGSYFHGHVSDSFKRRQKDDELKREQCEEAGIVLFEIYEELHGVWPHFNRLYSGLLDVLEENGVQVTGKPNLSDSAWMGLISRDREQTTLAGYIPDGLDPHVFLAIRPF